MMKKLIYIFAVMLLWVSCGKKEQETDFYDVKMINKSGADLNLYNYSLDKNGFPEDKNLRNGAEYRWKVAKDAKFPIMPQEPGAIAITFSPGFQIWYEGEESLGINDPRWFENYERIEEKGRVTFAYTFTKEHYQMALDKYTRGYITYKCVLVNKSGVKVTFEANVEDERVVFPEILELGPDEKFEWGFESIKSSSPYPVKTSYPEPIPVPFGNKIPDFSKVVFDDKAEVIYKRFDKERDPRFEKNYVKEVVDKKNEVYTYTFSEEDYQNALNDVSE